MPHRGAHAGAGPRGQAVWCLALVLALFSLFHVTHAQFNVNPIPAQCWPAGIISQDDYPYCRLLDQNFALHWSVQLQVVTFGIFISGSWNFAGIGITYGGLDGADIWMARSDDAQPWLANPWHADDYWSASAATGPVLDSQQDITLYTVEQTQTYTYIALQRPLDTCDRAQDLKIFNDTDQMLIFAYGPTYSPDLWQAAATAELQVRLNPTNFSASNVTNTTASYYLEMYTEDPSDLQGVAITTANFPVPTNQSYFFRCFDLDIGTYLENADVDPLSYKYHVIRYGGVKTSPLFHHTTLYACSQPHPAGAPPRYTCAGKPHPYCATYYAIWTPSAGNVSLPKEAGLPLGFGSYRYFTLINHYVIPNPGAGQPAVRDSSGIVLYLTQQALRPNDAAVLKLGTYSSIPLGTPDGTQLSTRSTCSSACTSNVLANSNNTNNATSLKLFSAFFRLPASGQGIQTRHTRFLLDSSGAMSQNATEIQPLAVRPYWNASFQRAMTTLPQSRLLMSGDSLVTECNVTYAASDPSFAWMDYCQALVMYFPATNFTDCGTYDGAYSATTMGSGAAGAPPPQPVQMCGSANAFPSAVAGSLLASMPPPLGTVPPGLPPGALSALPPGMAGSLPPSMSLPPGTFPPPPSLAQQQQQQLAAALSSLQQSGALFPGPPSSWLLLFNASLPPSLWPPSSTWGALPNTSLYLEPCQQYTVPAVIPQTGAAVSAIVGVSVALMLFGYFLWARFGKHDDAERQQLIEEMVSRLHEGEDEDRGFVVDDRR